MKSIKKILSLVAACSIIATFSAMTPVYADNEITITPVVEVKLGTAAYVAYDGQELAVGDKVRVKYEYAGPETPEIWSDPYYDEDNDIDYPAELKGGTSITQSGFYVDYLDSTYFTAGNPTFYAASTAAQWLTKDGTYATTAATPGISFATMSAYVNGGIYKSAGRIAQVVYTVAKELDKDFVIGPADGFNYKFTLGTAGVDGVETGNVVYETKANGVQFNTVTLKAAAGEDEPALEEAEEVKAFTEEGSAPATAFKVDTTAVEGKQAYWTATIGGTPMITKNAIPNVSGNVTLGLVFHGTQSISNVNLLWK